MYDMLEILNKPAFWSQFDNFQSENLGRISLHHVIIFTTHATSYPRLLNQKLSQSFFCSRELRLLPLDLLIRCSFLVILLLHIPRKKTCHSSQINTTVHINRMPGDKNNLKQSKSNKTRTALVYRCTSICIYRMSHCLSITIDNVQ